MYITDNPDRDFDRWDREQESWKALLPVCSECDEPIQSESCYEINGEYICEDCMNDNHKKYTTDLIM